MKIFSKWSETSANVNLRGKLHIHNLNPLLQQPYVYLTPVQYEFSNRPSTGCFIISKFMGFSTLKPKRWPHSLNIPEWN